MSRRQSRLTFSVVLGALLLGVMFLPGAQRAIGVVISPLRNLTYPQPTAQPVSAPNAVQSNNSDDLQVISYSANPGRRQIIVDIGERDVATSDAVTAGGILVGVVESVQANTAHVTLINDPSFRVIAETERGARGLIVAEYNQLVLSDVADNQSLQGGDQVRTLNSQYQNVGAVSVGIVDEVLVGDGLLQSALLRQPIELNDLSYVSIP